MRGSPRNWLKQEISAEENQWLGNNIPRWTNPDYDALVAEMNMLQTGAIDSRDTVTRTERFQFFLGGALLYAIPAIGWYFLMRSHSLAAIGVIYSAGTIIAMAVLGVMFFRETIGMRESVGIALALASVVVIGGV